MLGGEPGQDFGSALDQEPSLAIVQLDQNAHGLALGRKGHHFYDASVGANLAVIGPPCAFGKGEQSDFSLGPDETALGAVLVRTLESGRVDGDGVIEEILQGFR